MLRARVFSAGMLFLMTERISGDYVCSLVQKQARTQFNNVVLGIRHQRC